MTIASGSLVEASDYNTIQTKVDSILGTGSGDKGYGQAVSSSQQSSGAVITDNHINELFADIQKAHTHQQGSASSAIAQVTTADVIEANNGTSFKGWTQYSTAADLIETNRLTAASGGMTTTAAKTTETLSAGWNGSRNQIVTVVFADANARRHFFNSGGEIHIAASVASGGNTKSQDWATMCSSSGTIKIAEDGITKTGASGTLYGGYNEGTIPTSSTKIFDRTGSGNYAENTWTLNATNSADTLTLTLENIFNDADTGDQTGTGSAVDEDVDRALTVTIGELRATNANVTVASPTFTITDNI
jgi:hypothetical protein